jgi:hypothetical protein
MSELPQLPSPTTPIAGHTGYREDVPLHNTMGGPVPARVKFYSSGSLFTVNGVSGQSGDKPLWGDILDISYDKDLGNPTGSWSMTLINRPIQEGPLAGQWLADVIAPMDMVVISFRRGDRLRCAMVGVVGAAPTEHESPVSGGQGIPHTVTITGFDMGKMLLNAQIYWFKDYPDANLAAFALKGWKHLPEVIAGKSKAFITKLVLEEMFYKVTSLSYQRAEGVRSPVQKALGYKLGKTLGTIPAGHTFMNEETNLYGYLKDLAEDTWCEFYVDTLENDPSFMASMVREREEDNTGTVDLFDGAKPTIILRNTPFDKEDWDALPMFVITDDVIHQASIGGEPTIYNIFYAQPTAFGARDPLTNKVIGGVGYYDAASAARFGYRPLVVPSKIIPTYNDGKNMMDIQAYTALLTLRLYRWFAPSADFRSGTIVVQGNPCYRVGTKLRRQYLRRRNLIMDFYIEGVSGSWQAYGTYRTTLKVTRGLPYKGYRFPSPQMGPVETNYNTDVRYPFRT